MGQAETRVELRALSFAMPQRHIACQIGRWEQIRPSPRALSCEAAPDCFLPLSLSSLSSVPPLRILFVMFKFKIYNYCKLVKVDYLTLENDSVKSTIDLKLT